MHFNGFTAIGVIMTMLFITNILMKRYFTRVFLLSLIIYENNARTRLHWNRESRHEYAVPINSYICCSVWFFFSNCKLFFTLYIVSN